MEDLMCFVWVEFPEDPNVAGMKYWYASGDVTAAVGDKVWAPLGRHNTLQKGIIREVKFAEEYDSPFPLYLIKSIKKLIKEKE